MKTDTERLRLQYIDIEVGNDDDSYDWIRRELFDTEYLKPLRQILEEQNNDYTFWATVRLVYQSDTEKVTLEYINDNCELNSLFYEAGNQNENGWQSSHRNAEKYIDLNKPLGEILYLDDNWNFES